MVELPEPVQRMIDATNAGDSDAFVDAFAEDGVILDWGKPFEGREAIAGWNESDNIGRRSRFRVDGAERDGDDWIVQVTVSGGGFNGTSDLRFTVDGDRIRRLEITP